MCGRKTITKSKENIIEAFSLQAWYGDYKENYNVSPTQFHPVITDAEDVISARMMSWGLVPTWSKDKKFASNYINARRETIWTKPSFKRLLFRNRCLVPIDGFYEWRQEEDNKQAYYFHKPENKIFALAGLFDVWRTPDQNWYSYTIITKQAEGIVADYHTRMPIVLSPDVAMDWLKTRINQHDTNRIFRTSDMDFEVYPVSNTVNDLKHSSPECIEPFDPTK